MAYATSNPPRLISQSIGGAAGPDASDQTTHNGSLWMYLSADASTVVDAAGYFTNGWDLGIRPGDVLLQVDTDTYASAIMVCNAGSASVAVDFNDGTAIAVTDTD